MAITAALKANEIRYGFREGPGKGKEYPVKASQIFHRRGGCFCHIDSNGSIVAATQTPTGTAHPLFGWADVPKDKTNQDYWKAAANTDDGFPSKVFVITGIENRFEIPFDVASGTLSAALIGGGCTLASANMNATNIQKAYYQGTAASCQFIIYDVDTNASTVLLGLKGDMIQSVRV